MKLTEIVFLLLVCAIAVALCLHGWLVEGYGAIVIVPPALIALVLVVLAAVRVLRTLKIAPEGAERALQVEYWQELRGSVPALVWCMSAAPLLFLLGYPMGLAVFAGLFARVFGSGWTGSLLTAGLAFAVVWFAARGLLGVPIPLLPGWLA